MSFASSLDSFSARSRILDKLACIIDKLVRIIGRLVQRSISHHRHTSSHHRQTRSALDLASSADSFSAHIQPISRLPLDRTSSTHSLSLTRSLNAPSHHRRSITSSTLSFSLLTGPCLFISSMLSCHLHHRQTRSALVLESSTRIP